MNKIKNICKVIIILLIPFVNVHGQQNTEMVILDDLIEQGLTNNPQLKSFYTRIQVDSAKIPQAGSLPDPMLSLNLLNLPVDNFTFDQEPMTGKQIALKQTFPFPGKLSIKEKIAEKQVSISRENYRELELQLIRNIKQSYYDLYFIDEALVTIQKNYELLVEFVNIAEKKYAVGKGLQQDVLKAQVELSKIIDRQLELKQKREAVEATINALLNRDVDFPLGKTQKIVYEKVEVNLSTLEKLSVKRRPLFKAWQQRIEQNGDKINLARKQYWPDFSIFAAYTQRDVLKTGMGGVDFLSGGISVQLPLYFWRKQSKKVEETQFSKLTSEQTYAEISIQNFSSLDKSITDLNKNEERLDLYSKGIIPQASQALHSAMIGYETDKVDFLTLINNQMTLFNLQLEYSRILSDYNKNIAELEYLSGGDIRDTKN